MASSRGCALLVALALLACAAVAQECKITRQAQTANLANASPKGCLKDVVNATAGEVAKDLITPECFNKLNLNLTNVTGAAGCAPRTFTVAFADQKKCAEGFDVIANGNLTAGTKPGNYDAQGEFATSTPFTGTLNDKNQMTVSVQGSKCVLTYALKAVGKPVPVAADEATAAEKEPSSGSKAPAAADSKAPAGSKAAEAPKAADAPKKSAAAVSSVSVLLAILCAALALLL